MTEQTGGGGWGAVEWLRETFMWFRIDRQYSWWPPIQLDWTPNPRTRRVTVMLPGSGFGVTVWLVHIFDKKGQP